MAKAADKKVNVAIIGLGFGAEFIPIYQHHPNANMYAICQRKEQRLNKVGDEFGIAARYADYDDVLADPKVDFVHINSPIPDHAWMSIEALKAGKHVMCTVPMATTIKECDKICQLVRTLLQIFQIEYAFSHPPKKSRHAILQNFSAWTQQCRIWVKLASKRNEIALIPASAMQE